MPAFFNYLPTLGLVSLLLRVPKKKGSGVVASGRAAEISASNILNTTSLNLLATSLNIAALEMLLAGSKTERGSPCS